jgi:shikimate 5-dehydrogenase
MNEHVTFGVIGGYGATGRAAVSELWKSGGGEIVIGGRDMVKGKALAAEFDNRVSAAQVDVLDARSLDSFCGACSIVVATVARMISEGRGVQSGLHFLADSVDPLAFMTELRRAGVELTEFVCEETPPER